VDSEPGTAPGTITGQYYGTPQAVVGDHAWKVRPDGLALAGGELQMYGNTGAYGFSAIPLDTAGRPTALQTRRGPSPAPVPRAWAATPARRRRPSATAGSPACGPTPQARSP